MKKISFTQCLPIQAKDPEDFKTQFNEAMKELRGKKPKVETDLSDSFRALIFYTETEEEMDTVADEFHAEGLRFLCMHCPHYEDPGNKLKKHVACKYADLGRTHLEHEACELFYRQVKTGKVQPKDDPIPLEKICVKHGTGVRYI